MSKLFTTDAERAKRIAGESELGHLYRIEDTRVAAFSTDGDSRDVETQINVYAFRIVKITPQGYRYFNWVTRKEAWVSNLWNKRFALPTMEEAMDSFVHRKKRQISIYKAKIRLAEEALRRVGIHSRAQR